MSNSKHFKNLILRYFYIQLYKKWPLPKSTFRVTASVVNKIPQDHVKVIYFNSSLQKTEFRNVFSFLLT